MLRNGLIIASCGHMVMCNRNISQKGKFSFFFFFNDTATTEIYTLSLHDALPIWFKLEDRLGHVAGRDRKVDRGQLRISQN